MGCASSWVTPRIRVVTRGLIGHTDEIGRPFQVMDAVSYAHVASVDILANTAHFEGVSIQNQRNGAYVAHIDRPFTIVILPDMIVLASDDSTSELRRAHSFDTSTAVVDLEATREPRAPGHGRATRTSTGLLSRADLMAMCRPPVVVSTEIPMHAKSSGGAESDCTVCCAAPRNVAFACGHVLCADCSVRILFTAGPGKGTCPFCHACLCDPRKVFIN